MQELMLQSSCRMKQVLSKQARKLQATLEGCNPKIWITHSLTAVKCRATSVANNHLVDRLGSSKVFSQKCELSGRRRASFHFLACTTCAMQKHRRLSKNDFRTWVSRTQMIWSFKLASFPASLLASAPAGTQHVCPPILQLGSNPRQPRRKNSSILRASCHP